jgi:hypothetical protein
VQIPVGVYGTPFRQRIAAVAPTPTSGRLTKLCCPSTHHPIGKETGQTAHQERWYLTLQQRVGRFVRKTLSFSKSETNHEFVTHWFIILHNLTIRSSLTL